MRLLIVNALGWMQFISALFLLVWLVWSFVRDTKVDWLVARAYGHHTPEYEQGLGIIRLHRIRLVEATLLLVIGILMIAYGVPVRSSLVGRVAVVVITWLQMLKVFNDRWTRLSVFAAMAKPVTAAVETVVCKIDDLEARQQEVQLRLVKALEENNRLTREIHASVLKR